MLLGERVVTIYDRPQMVSTYPCQARGWATRLERYPSAAQAFLQGTLAACLEPAQASGAATGAGGRALLEPYTLSGCARAGARGA